MNFDAILGLIGEMGPYQIKLMFLVCLSALPEAMHSMIAVFMTADMDHWCEVEEWSQSVDDCYVLRDVNTDQYLECMYQYRNSSIPRSIEDGEVVYSRCSKYDTDYPSQWYDGYYAYNYTNSTTECDQGWVYDQSQYKSTIVNSFDLTCEKQYLPDTSQSLFYVGYLLGSFLSGSLADIIGRYKTFFIAILVDFTAGFIQSFAPSFWFFCLFRFLVGVSNISIYLMSYVIVTELVGPSRRVIAGIAPPLAFSVGSMILAGFALGIRDWRNLQRLSSLCLLPCLLLIPILPESARWLMARNRFEETEKILQKTAKGNNSLDKLPENLIEILEKEQEATRSQQNTPTIIDLFRVRTLRRRTLLLYALWFTNSLIYFGLSLNTADLGSNDYVTFFISAAVEFPANLIVIPLIESFLGRRFSEFILLAVGGTCCLITSFLDNETAITAVAMTGKFCITASFTIAYIYSSEVFPTTVRSIGMGSCSTIARIGSILAPLMIILGDVFDDLHLIIFAILALLVSFLVLLLPETRGKPLQNTIEQIDDRIDMKEKNVESTVQEVKDVSGEKGSQTDETDEKEVIDKKMDGYDNISYLPE